MENSKRIAANIAVIREQIAMAAAASGRPAEAIQLIAVTKTQDWAACQAALAAGITILGENRQQEAQDKFPPDFGQAYPGCSLHFIGQIQSNKIRKIVRQFDCIQSLASIDHAKLIDKEAAAIGKVIEVLFEVNTSGESSKGGVADQDSLFRLVEAALGLTQVRLRGLMTIGPLGSDQSRIQAAFAQLRGLSDSCQTRFNLADWGQLSMGMSGDFPLAIAEGATHIRIGTALFGPRLAPMGGMA